MMQAVYFCSSMLEKEIKNFNIKKNLDKMKNLNIQFTMQAVYFCSVNNIKQYVHFVLVFPQL